MKNVIILGAAGFIGTNLAIALEKDKNNKVTVVDRNIDYFKPLKDLNLNIEYKEISYEDNADFDSLLNGQDVVYHLISTSMPSTSNGQIPEEIKSNVVLSARLLDACVRQNIKKVVFISSGGTVYGKEVNCPIKEDSSTYPISSYGIQKVSIEKLLYLYNYLYGLDYRVIRLANPYGPYQRPNGLLGAVTTFTYKAINNEEILVYGDGSVVRDFIYIDDAINGILNIENSESKYKTFNLGSGKGTSIKDLLNDIKEALNIELNITYKEARKVDVPVNYLDISRYEEACGKLNPTDLKEGIVKTADFLKSY